MSNDMDRYQLYGGLNKDKRLIYDCHVDRMYVGSPDSKSAPRMYIYKSGTIILYNGGRDEGLRLQLPLVDREDGSKEHYESIGLWAVKPLVEHGYRSIEWESQLANQLLSLREFDLVQILLDKVS